MPQDAFDSHASGLSSPITHIETVTPSDVTDLARATRAISVGEAGWVRMITVGETTGDLYLGAGVPFPVRARRILATGTTATGIRGLS